MKRFIYSTVLLSALGVALAGCTKDGECGLNSTQVTYEDWTGFDGCSIVLVGDSVNYEAQQWDCDCGELSEGDLLCIQYEDLLSASICMVGPTIKVTSCEKLN